MQLSRRILPVLNALLVFEAAARLSSFTRAGRTLGMSQPSVSRFVANLEHHLGVRLFERLHNRLRLTPTGERLYQAAHAGFSEISRVCAEIDANRRPGILTVQCTHGFAHMWLLPRIRALLDRLPGWRLRTVSTDGQAVDGHDDADLVVHLGNAAADIGESVLLFREQVFPVCAPDFLERSGLARNADPVSRFAELPLICEDFGEHGWMGWADWLAHHGIDYRYPEDTHPLSNYALVLQAAMAGEGIALAWGQLAEPYLANGWLVEIPGLRVATPQAYYLSYRDSGPLTGPIRRWIEGLDVDASEV